LTDIEPPEYDRLIALDPFREPLFQLVPSLAWMQASFDDARGQSDNQVRRFASWRCPLAMVNLRFPADSCVNRGSSCGMMLHRARSEISTVSAVIGGGTSKAARHGDAVHFWCAVGHGKPWRGKRERDCGEVTGSCWRVHSGSGPPFPQTMRAKWVTQGNAAESLLREAKRAAPSRGTEAIA
jgi:hypothetical protein